MLFKSRDIIIYTVQVLNLYIQSVYSQRNKLYAVFLMWRSLLKQQKRNF